MEELIKKWKELCMKANQHGIPVPLVRDPKKGRGSVSLTMVFISFNIWLVSIINDVAQVFGGLNTDSAFNMFIACAGLYWGRKLTKDDKSITVAEELHEVLEKGSK